MKAKHAAVAVIILTCSVLFTGFISNGSDNSENYKQIAEEVGEKYSVCPELIEALIETDSLVGDRVGVMHLNPELQKDRMTKLGVSNLGDPEINILVGTDYMLELFEENEDAYDVLYIFLEATPEQSNYIWDVLDRSYEL